MKGYLPVLLLMMLVLPAYALTSGSGTIQDCKNNAWDVCTISVSSTIPYGDYSIVNRKVVINPGVVVTLNASRLLINSSDLIWVQGVINATAQHSIVWGSQVNGGSGSNYIGGTNTGGVAYPGTNNGASGIFYTPAPPNNYVLGDSGFGSGYPPFEYVSGSGGTAAAYVCSGGGFYATGGSDIPDLFLGASEYAVPGGSGQAVKLYSANITIDGDIEADAGLSAAGGSRNGIAGGSGGGEILLYGNIVNVGGDLSVKGSDGVCAPFSTACSAGGGDGGRVKVCAKASNSSTGIINVSGGYGAFVAMTAPNGSNGTSVGVVSGGCFPDVIVGHNTDDNQNFSTLTPTFNMSVGVFNNSNVSCYYTLDGTTHALGDWNISTGMQDVVFTVAALTQGYHHLSMTCGNVSAGIAEQTTDSLLFGAVDCTAPPTGGLTITAPTSGAAFFNPYSVPVYVSQVAGIFNSSNVTINGAYVTDFSGGYSGVLIAGMLTTGANNLSVQGVHVCGGTYATSVSFTYIHPTSTDVFTQAFGLDISACPNAEYNELIGKCPEYYKIPSVFNFSAVPCQALNLSMNYSCLSSVTNVTKVGQFSNWTIFYTPSYWVYHGAIGTTNETVQATGAEFVYNSKFVTHGGGMELIDNSSFMYVPAQLTPVDCGYQYTSYYGTDVCSYHFGFITNNRIVAVADQYNQWYTAAGTGVSNSSLVSTEPVIYVNVVPLAAASTNPFAGGMYTRRSCVIGNTTYDISLRNTVGQKYVVFYNTNASGVMNYSSYASNSTDLVYNLNKTDLVLVSVYDSEGIVCLYGDKATLFLPFDMMGGLFNDGFSNFFVKILLLFSIVLAAVVPYTLIITFVLNDMYHVLTLGDIGTITVIAVIAGIANNIYSPERGIKNMVVVCAVCLGYLSLLYVQLNAAVPSQYNAVAGLMESFNRFTTAQTLADQVIGFFGAIVGMFGFILTLPMLVMDLLSGLLMVILPGALWTPLNGVLYFIKIGAVIWFWLKAYEVLANKFRPV